MPHERVDRPRDVSRTAREGGACRHEDYLAHVLRKLTQARRLPEHPLAPIPKHCVSEPLRRNEGDPSQAAFVIHESCHAYEPMVRTSSAKEDPLKVTPGLDGPHSELDGKLLATLGAAARENGTTTLCGHAGTKSVSLRALSLIRLVRTLHFKTLLEKVPNVNKL